MVITTKRLSIVCSITSEWLDVTIYPNYSSHRAKNLDKITISYDEENIESDVEIAELIGIFNGEPTWRRLYLSGASLEMPEENEELYPYSFNTLELDILIGHKLDFFSISWDDLWTKGVSELKFITEDYTSGNSALSVKTLIRLEALKRIRQALLNSTAEDLKYLKE